MLRIALGILCLIIAAWLIVFIVRTNQAYHLLMKLNWGGYGCLRKYLTENPSPNEEEYNKLKERCNELFDRYSYNKLTFVLKPLRLECWFTPEETELIENGWEYYNEIKK